jgi:hypothetical protein
VDLLVDVPEYLLELPLEIRVVLEDLLGELLSVVIVGVVEKVLESGFKLPESLPFEARGCERNLAILAEELLGVVLEVSLHLNQESSETLLVASILAWCLELGLDGVGLKLGDLGVGLVKKLLKLRY